LLVTQIDLREFIILPEAGVPLRSPEGSNMSDLSRRAFNQATLGSLLTFSLLESLFCKDAFADEIKPLAAQWLADLNALSLDVKSRKLTQVEWQQQVEALMDKADLPDLMKFVDFERLTRDVELGDHGEKALQHKFPEVEGLPTRLVFGHQIFGLKKDRSIAPHGHNNMATAFLMLKGKCHGRHYDRLEDGDDFMIIRPTIDEHFEVGQYSTISDHKDNIHWFKATSETAFIFNIHVLNIDAAVSAGGRVYIDPFGEPLAHGLIKAKRLEYKQAYEKFG
jgi:hypothetical protein